MFQTRTKKKILERQKMIRAAAPPSAVAPRGPAAVTPPSQFRKGLELLLGFVRDIRAEAQNLMRSLLEVKSKSKLINKKIRAQELKASLSESSKIFEHNKTQIQSRLVWLRDLLLQRPQIYDLYGDEIAIIENLWERVSLNWPSPKEEDEAEVLQRITKVDQDLGDLIFHAGYLTIPPRVNQHLRQLRIGQYLDFHSTFEDELPKLEDRVKILRLIHSHPLVIEGVADVENGLIYRASQHHWRRLMSYLLMLGTFLAGALVVFLFTYIGTWLNLQDWPVGPARFTELFVGYLFITLGGIAHIGIDALKQARASKGQTFVALGDLLLWVHIKELSIIAGIVSLLIGILALAGLFQKIEWQMVFFVGYSIDSFVDLFLQRFTKTAAISTEVLMGKLG